MFVMNEQAHAGSRRHLRREGRYPPPRSTTTTASIRKHQTKHTHATMRNCCCDYEQVVTCQILHSDTHAHPRRRIFLLHMSNTQALEMFRTIDRSCAG